MRQRLLVRILCAALQCCLLMCLAALSDARMVQAQTYPAKPIRLVVPFGPGGPTDVAARIVAQILPPALGQSVVIENRPGAGGATGSKSVAAADPDGYTLLIGTSATLAVVPALVRNPGYDPIRSFVPVAKLADSTTVLVATPSFPPNTVAELVAYAKAHPAAVSYASAGPGNQTHLAAELLRASAGIELVHVPYKSGAEMVTAVLGQQVQIAFPDISILLPLIHDRKVKALAVTSGERHPQLPEVPTMRESGFADHVTTFWTGVIAPTGTPPAIVDKLNATIRDGLRTAQIRDALAKVGAQASPGTAHAFAEFIAAETQKWLAIAKLAGMTAN
ncbi:MAG: Bug family tripartite tricarboxylate transporter substrate binding protein [Xanthobacteraceae bacterium]